MSVKSPSLHHHHHHHHHHHRQQPHLPKKLRWFIFISLVTVLYLLRWIQSSEKASKFWTHYYRVTTSEHQIQGEPTVLRICGSGRGVPQGQKVSLLAVNRTKTLLVSAYQEHRIEKKVRVIAVVLRSETVAYSCIFCCENQRHISEGVSNIHDDHFGFAYGTADIMCPLPSSCNTPSQIAVTSAPVSSTDKHDSFTFLEVKNQGVKTDSFPYNFTVCISTMYDFTNVLQLVQSLEMLQLLGVNRVVVYKTSCSPDTQRILDYYTHKGLVEVIPWSVSRFVNVSRSWLPEHGPGDLHYFGQIPALNDCLYRYMYRSRYIALHDMDELILPQSVNSWSELLPLLEEKYGADQCYQFENNVFPNVVTQPQRNSCCPGWQHVPGVNILDHLYHEPITSDISISNFKIIVNPKVVFRATVHGLLESLHGCSWVDRNIARMYHTRAPKQPNLTQDQLIYDGRLLNYSAPLTLNVNTVLRANGLLPKDSIQ
ncbi:uncharacterized protein ABDE67_002134 isoform 2-T2 [Symphorus nematophorus]